jgi:hypothetical protein
MISVASEVALKSTSQCVEKDEGLPLPTRMNSVLNLVLSHQAPAAVAKMLDYWSEYVPRESILLAYGGPKEEFESINHPQKSFVDDPDLRTFDHQREFQSYTAIFRAGAKFLQTHPEFHYIHFAEFDHLPLVPDLNERQVEKLIMEGADVLGFHVHRVDGTSNPHFLHHLAQDDFASHWFQISRRAEPEVVLSMFGSGSFWTREAFSAVAASKESFPVYLELYLPTLAHHLGFRLRNFTGQNRFVRINKDETGNIEQARAEGAWTLHPVKTLWTN